jgi:hypothetical protein
MSGGGRFGFVGGPLDGEVLRLPRRTDIIRVPIPVPGNVVDVPIDATSGWGEYELVRHRPFGGEPYYRWIGRTG